MLRPSAIFGASFLLSTLLGCGSPTGDVAPPGPVPEPCAAMGITSQSRFADGSMTGHPDPFGAAAQGKARAARIRDQAWIRQPSNARQKVQLGDLLLINDKIAVYIEDTGLSDGYQALGGEILAIEPVGSDGKPSGTSQYGETILAFSRQAVGPERVTVLSDGSDGKAAVVRVAGLLSNIPFLTEGFGSLLNQEYNLPAALDYVLEPGSERLRVKLSLMNPSGDAVDISNLQGAGFFHSARSQRFTPESGYAEPTDLAKWVGFDNPGASFAMRWLGGQLSFALARSGFELYRMSGLKMAACESKTLDYVEWIASGPGIDNLRAAIRRVDGDSSWRTLTGAVTESGGGAVSGALVHLRSATGAYLSRVSTDARGQFAIQVPGEPVDLLVTQGGYAISTAQRVMPAESTAAIALPQNGRLVVHARDSVSKQALPVRIQIIPDVAVPKFSAEMGIDQEYNGRAAVEFSPTGEAAIALRPGQHRVLVSHGFEWEILDQKVMITAGKDTELTAELLHSVDSTGVMCADFHIHSYYSADSSDGVSLKVKSAIADGLEIPVSSEHEWIVDFQPLIKELGLDSWAFGFSSEEFTTFTWGHFGIVPISVRPEKVNNGAVPWIGMKPPEVFHNISQLPEKPVLIINHPRSDSFGGYFTSVDYQPSTGTGDPELWSSEFEAIEVFNDSDFDSNRDQSVKDWFSMLNAGRKVWAVGNSDSHSVRNSPIGYPRTCFRFGHDDPKRLSAAGVRDVLRAGQGVVSGGLYMTVSGPGGMGPGDTVPSSADPAEFHIVVQAPGWLSASRLEVLLNGETERTVELQEVVTGGSGHRYEATVTLKRSARPQNWVVFHAKAVGRDLSPIYPGRNPFAVSNPIFF